MMWDSQIQNFRVGGTGGGWDNYEDDDEEELEQQAAIDSLIKEDQELFLRYRKQGAGASAAKHVAAASSDIKSSKKKRKRDGDDDDDDDDDDDGDEDDDREKTPASDASQDDVLFGGWRPSGAIYASQLAGSPWDISILMKRYLVFGLYNAENVYNAVDLYTGKLTFLVTNQSYTPSDDSHPDYVWDKFNYLIKRIVSDDFEWRDVGIDLEFEEPPVRSLEKLRGVLFPVADFFVLVYSL
jgi:hypothetical protein